MDHPSRMLDLLHLECAGRSDAATALYRADVIPQRSQSGVSAAADCPRT
ncbi:MAG: hypothetical protein HY650_00070, partial [Acidobacteria bacterium]|nr:hypothetical protein [Acidobacteriota bacterium]